MTNCIAIRKFPVYWRTFMYKYMSAMSIVYSVIIIVIQYAVIKKSWSKPTACNVHLYIHYCSFTILVMYKLLCRFVHFMYMS